MCRNKCLIDGVLTKNNSYSLCSREHFYKCPLCGVEYKINGVKDMRKYVLNSSDVDKNIVVLFSNDNKVIYSYNREKFKLCEIVCSKCVKENGFRQERIEIRRKSGVLPPIKPKFTNKCHACENSFKTQYHNQRLCPKCASTKINFKCNACGKEIKSDIRLIYEYLVEGRRIFYCSQKCQRGGYKYCQKCEKKTFWNFWKWCSVCNSSWKDPKVKEKIKQVMKERYGAESPQQVHSIQEKTRATNMEKFGVEHPAQCKEVMDKMKATNMEKFGVENAYQSEKIKEKIKNTNQKNHGVDYPMQSKEILEKSKKTCNKNYGVDYIFLINNSSLGSWGIRTRLVFSNQEFVTRSFWETIFSLYLYYNGVGFEYECLSIPYQFGGECHTYYPDFYLPEFNYIVEVKGYQKDPEREEVAWRAAMDEGYGFEVVRDVSFFESWLVEAGFDVESLRVNSKLARSYGRVFEFFVG